MNENQFNTMMRTLTMIEGNTRKKESSTPNPKSSLISECIDEAVQQVQELFFSKLQMNLRWTREGVRELFVESVESIRNPTPTHFEERPF